MDKLKIETILVNSKTTTTDIEQFASIFDQTQIPQLIDLLLLLQKIITNKSEPYAQLNATLCLLTLLKTPQYQTVNIVQYIFIPLLMEPAKVAATQNQNKIYDYFQNLGFNGNTPNLQTLSYHFTKHSLILCLLTAYLKPKRLYRNKQCIVESFAKEQEKQLFKEGLTQEMHEKLSETYEFLNLRKIFLKNIISFNRNPHDFIDYYMRQLQYFLLHNTKSSQFKWLKVLLKEGDIYLSSEGMARLAEIFCFHTNFRIKRQALLLILEFIGWGDLQALLMINFTEYFKHIAQKIIQAKNKQKNGNFNVFPQIQGQVQQKKGFVNEFLLAVQKCAKIFPTLQSYFMDSGNSPIFQLWKNLKQNGLQFSKWEGQQLYETKILQSFRTKKQLNLCYLQQLDKQRGDSFSLDPIRPTFRSLNRFYQKNKLNLLKICEKKDWDEMCDQWKELIFFCKYFQQFLERMADEASEKELDNLIEEGLSLKSNIQNLQIYFAKRQGGLINSDEFKNYIQSKLWQNYTNEEVKEKASTVKQSMKNKEKDGVKIALSECGQIVKQKITMRIQQLAIKRTDSMQEVSQLQLNSRPFLAHKLHSKQMIQKFMPLIHYHPLRKQKRMRAGIKICSQKVQIKQPKGSSTPKFRSVIEQQHKIRKGIKVLQKDPSKYDKYLMVLDQRECIKYLVFDKIQIVQSKELQITRQELILNGNKLTVKFICKSPSITQLTYNIQDQPSIRIKIIQNKSEQLMSIELEGEWIKFGFNLPTISFSLKQKQIIQTVLPFSFNNFITISKYQQIDPKQVKHVKKTASHQLDTKYFSKTNQISRYLKGIQHKQNVFSGKVHFFQWQCNIFIFQEDQLFWIQQQAASENQQNLLMDFLSIFLVRLFAEQPILS